MEITSTPLQGLMIIQPNIFKDDRGYFFESYNKKVFEDASLDLNFVQDNQSLSEKDTLRGLHFQLSPYKQGKLVSVIRGAAQDVVVDIRKNSPTYGKHFSIILNEDNKTCLWVPIGFAHGFLALEDNTILSYKCTEFYNQESEGGIIWNDESLNIKWLCENPKLSKKDKLQQQFKNLNIDKVLSDRLKSSREIQEKLKKEGYCCPISWEDMERAMIYNHNEQKKYKDG